MLNSIGVFSNPVTIKFLPAKLEFINGFDDRFAGLFMKNRPVSPSITVSVAPPRPNAMTGVPQACASTGAIPKSSSAAKMKARARIR